MAPREREAPAELGFGSAGASPSQYNRNCRSPKRNNKKVQYLIRLYWGWDLQGRSHCNDCNCGTGGAIDSLACASCYWLATIAIAVPPVRYLTDVF